jgi:iron(III) transport system substrate-binding protein
MERLFCFTGKRRMFAMLALTISLEFALIISPAYSSEWQETLAAAKKEGVVSVWGPPGTWARKTLAEAFNKTYPDIKVDYQAVSGSSGWPKFARERIAGLYTVDVHVGGTGTAADVLYGEKVLEPIEPALILPEVKDKKHWWDGRHHYSDPENKYIFVFIIDSSPAIAYNTQMDHPKQLKSYADLLDLKWEGKIVMHDPRVRGPGSARWLFYVQSMGQEFVKKLAKQLVLTRDFRQGPEWVATGKYPIATGISDVETREFAKKGAPIAQIPYLKEGANLTAGWGTANLLTRAPHPNAAKVYINWLLSKEGQLAWQTETTDNSARIDIPKDMVASEKHVVKGVRYFPNYTAESLRLRIVSDKLAQEYLK